MDNVYGRQSAQEFYKINIIRGKELLMHETIFIMRQLCIPYGMVHYIIILDKCKLKNDNLNKIFTIDV